MTRYKSAFGRWMSSFMVAMLMAGPIVTGRALAVEVGQQAPDFKLPGTMGADVSLSDFRGKKWVLLEFYGNDFVPT